MVVKEPYIFTFGIAGQSTYWRSERIANDVAV